MISRRAMFDLDPGIILSKHRPTRISPTPSPQNTPSFLPSQQRGRARVLSVFLCHRMVVAEFLTDALRAGRSRADRREEQGRQVGHDDLEEPLRAGCDGAGKCSRIPKRNMDSPHRVEPSRSQRRLPLTRTNPNMNATADRSFTSPKMPVRRRDDETEWSFSSEGSRRGGNGFTVIPRHSTQACSAQPPARLRRPSSPPLSNSSFQPSSCPDHVRDLLHLSTDSPLLSSHPPPPSQHGLGLGLSKPARLGEEARGLGCEDRADEEDAAGAQPDGDGQPPLQVRRGRDERVGEVGGPESRERGELQDRRVGRHEHRPLGRRRRVGYAVLGSRNLPTSHPPTFQPLAWNACVLGPALLADDAPLLWHCHVRGSGQARPAKVGSPSPVEFGMCVSRSKSQKKGDLPAETR
ncbi:unnamed protein product [Diplocarpon coronariae]|nr:hypothetical protein JHW43_001374 [Diplocarpon mali]